MKKRNHTSNKSHKKVTELTDKPTTKTNPVTSKASVVVPLWKEAPKFSSYHEVKFYRKLWFVVLCILLFTPALFAILLTGSVYKLDQQTGEVLEATDRMRRLIYIIIAVVFVFGLLRAV